MSHDINNQYVFQVQGMVAAAPRASGFTSVIPPFRRYQSQGYSTLRHTCSFMRNCCNVMRWFDLVLLSAHACMPLLTSSACRWRKEKGKTSQHPHLVLHESSDRCVFWIQTLSRKLALILDIWKIHVDIEVIIFRFDRIKFTFLLFFF